MRTTLLAAALLPLALAACGDDKKESAVSTASVTTPLVTSPAVTSAAVTTQPVTVAADTAPAVTIPSPAGAGATGSTVAVELKEYTVSETGPITAGEVTFNVKNNGERTHELLVIKGKDYDSLPHQANGAVDESALAPGDMIGKTDRLDGGQSATLTVNLPAGQYVLVCNLGVGPGSHAARGQHLAITVG